MINKITTAEMELLVAGKFVERGQLVVPNVYWGIGLMHECDILVMSAVGYLTEIEIKVSLSDLKKDKEKSHGHNSDIIKYLYFAIPEYLEKHIEHIPDRAGIFVIKEFIIGDIKRKFVHTLRPAMLNKGCRPLLDKYKLAKLGALRIWNLKQRIFDLKEELKKEKESKDE